LATIDNGFVEFPIGDSSLKVQEKSDGLQQAKRMEALYRPGKSLDPAPVFDRQTGGANGDMFAFWNGDIFLV
jgi:hypothetical protein